MPAVVPARATHGSADKTMPEGCSLFPNMFPCKNYKMLENATKMSNLALA